MMMVMTDGGDDDDDDNDDDNSCDNNDVIHSGYIFALDVWNYGYFSLVTTVV